VKTFYVYMVSNRSRSVLYTGITNSLERRLWFHANAKPGSFVKRYRCDRLVYYESFNSAGDAISREKQIKGWRRQRRTNWYRR
jgi:putative endonuclease